LTRWYDVSVVYEGNLSNVNLSGIISKRQKVGDLLEILETTHKVQFNMEGNKITVKPYPLQ
jgi:transmembrane sensor